MEREADAVKEELGLGGWQPAAGQDIIISTTTTTTTISTVGTGLSTSEHYNGAQFLAAEEGESSLALKNGGGNLYDSKTSHETAVLDLTATTSGSINPEVHKEYFKKDVYLEKVYTATTSGIQGEGEINPKDLKDHFRKDLCLDTVYTVAESDIQGGGEINLEDHFRKDLYLDTVYTKPEKYLFYCSKCKASIEMVLIRREEEMIKCPTCSECVKFIGSWVLQKFTREEPEPPLSTINSRDNVVNIGDDSSPPLLPPPPPPPKSPIKWEILKSIVYGGLIESITSLSIVTSAASSATATLNIEALALANLIGGLFVIGHNLRELKNDQSRVASNQEGEEVNRYEEILGQKKNFILHASVAVLSFLVFGLVPPLVYGFSFYKSDNEYLKLVAVAAVSLLCITLLAVAKASIQNPPVSKYITAVLHYLVIGVGASGISYLAGYLVEKLIEKLGLFKSTAATVTLPLPAMSPMKNG